VRKEWNHDAIEAVKTKEEESIHLKEIDNQVSRCIVCADSYFASVATALELKRLGLRFIGVVKTATKRFPLKHLSGLELRDRGGCVGLMSKRIDGQSSLLAFVWMDRNRRYFIATGSCVQAGKTYSRNRWRQED
jgi:hypothetical protein